MNEEIREIVEPLTNMYKGLTILQVADYNRKYYIVSATENPNEIDYNDPWWAIEKLTGKVTSYSPMPDLKNFGDAIENRSLYIRGRKEN